jgi:hypothetical protein
LPLTISVNPAGAFDPFLVPGPMSHDYWRPSGSKGVKRQLFFPATDN